MKFILALKLMYFFLLYIGFTIQANKACCFYQFYSEISFRKDLEKRIGRSSSLCEFFYIIMIHLLLKQRICSTFGNILVQQAKMIRQTKVWISWSGGIDSKTKGAERRKQGLGMVLMGKFRGPFQRANELKINIIICFRKAQDEPYKCYEDSVFYNGLQNIQFRPSRLLREDGRELDEMIRAELRGPLQRTYEVGLSIIICFRKAQDEPYKCCEDSVFYNGPQHIRIRPLSFMRTKRAVSCFIVSNYCHDSAARLMFQLEGGVSWTGRRRELDK